MTDVTDSGWNLRRIVLMPIGGELHVTIEDTHLLVWVINDCDQSERVKVYLHGENYRTVEEARLVGNMFCDVIGGNHKGGDGCIATGG